MAHQELLRRIHSLVLRARRRQAMQLALAWLPCCLAIALLLLTTWFALEPQLPVRLLPWVAPAAAVTITFLGTALAVWLRMPSRLNAALALDRAFGLQERMTTAISLDADLRTSPAGMALLDDARKHLDGLDVPRRFPLKTSGREWLAPAGAVAALLVASFFPWTPGLGRAPELAASTSPAVMKIEPLQLQAIKQANEERRQRIKDIDDEKLKELQAEFDKLVASLDKLDKPADAQMTLQDVTKLAEQVQKRQEELAKSQEMKRKLQGDDSLKQQQDGPTKDLQKALSQGDMNKAKEEIEKLAEKLKNKKLSDEEKKKLAEGLKDLKDKLKELADQKKKMEALAKSNLDPETKQQEMQKLQQQMEGMKDLAKLAEMMQKAQQNLERGDNEQALNDLNDLADQLKEMGLDEKALSELELAESELEEIKEGLG